MKSYLDNILTLKKQNLLSLFCFVFVFFCSDTLGTQSAKSTGPQSLHLCACCENQCECSWTIQHQSFLVLASVLSIVVLQSFISQVPEWRTRCLSQASRSVWGIAIPLHEIPVAQSSFVSCSVPVDRRCSASVGVSSSSGWRGLSGVTLTHKSIREGLPELSYAASILFVFKTHDLCREVGKEKEQG